MSIMTFVGLDMLMGLKTPKLIVPTEFKVQQVIVKLHLKKNVFRNKIKKCASLTQEKHVTLNYWWSGIVLV